MRREGRLRALHVLTARARIGRGGRDPQHLYFPGDPGGGDDALDQIASGADIFARTCAHCHGAEGQGGEGPALNDERSMRAFRTASRLHAFVRLSMPYDAPGGLLESEYYDVVAFLLDWNGLNPDGIVIDAESVDDFSLVD